jgi:hypothetical protein
VRDESHLDDMRAAIRGDFERLARRRGSQELMHAPAEPALPGEAPPTTEPEKPEPVAEVELAAEPDPIAEPEQLATLEAAQDGAAQEEPAAEEEAPRQGFFARLLGL